MKDKPTQLKPENELTTFYVVRQVQAKDYTEAIQKSIDELFTPSKLNNIIYTKDQLLIKLTHDEQ